jgi:hypothetical protein
MLPFCDYSVPQDYNHSNNETDDQDKVKLTFDIITRHYEFSVRSQNWIRSNVR